MVTLTIGDFTLKAELAVTKEQLITGLSNRDSLPHNEGLLLILPQEGRIPITMKDMRFPIDVLFLDKSQKVVEIKENFVPWSVYFPRKKARYVVEIPKGWTKKSKTDIGDRIVFRQGNI